MRHVVPNLETIYFPSIPHPPLRSDGTEIAPDKAESGWPRYLLPGRPSVWLHLPNQFMSLFALANCRQIYKVESYQGLPYSVGQDLAFQPGC
jgi:hypothetical protein